MTASRKPIRTLLPVVLSRQPQEDIRAFYCLNGTHTEEIVMNNTRVLFQEPSPPDPDLWSYRVLGDQNFSSARGLLAWWYALTAPPDPLPGTSFAQRDLVRRGRIASAIMLFLACVLTLVAPIGLLGPNKQILFTAITVWVVIAICIPLNRRGKVNLAGVLLCLSVITGLYVSILRAPGGMSPDEKDILYLLIFGELLIGVILPVNWVFVPALLNICFGVLELTMAPHTPLFAAQLLTSGPTILFRLIQIHVLVTAVIWIVGTHAQEAIKRADRAEEIARLQHALVQVTSAQVQEALQLQATIQTLITTLNRIAQGEMQARVPLVEGETLWPLAGSLNTLLARYQRAQQDAQELARIRPQVECWRQLEQSVRWMKELEGPFTATVTRALQEQQPLRLPPNQTPLAPFFRQLDGKYLSDRPLPLVVNLSRMSR